MVDYEAHSKLLRPRLYTLLPLPIRLYGTCAACARQAGKDCSSTKDDGIVLEASMRTSESREV